MSLEAMNDDDLSRPLFEIVVEKLDAEQARDRFLAVYNRSPDQFSLQRADGCMLTIESMRFMRAVARSGHRATGPEELLWTFKTVPSPDGRRLRPDPNHAGSIDEIAETIVRTSWIQGKCPRFAPADTACDSAVVD
jgi:hypothetical protein